MNDIVMNLDTSPLEDIIRQLGDESHKKNFKPPRGGKYNKICLGVSELDFSSYHEQHLQKLSFNDIENSFHCFTDLLGDLYPLAKSVCKKNVIGFHALVTKNRQWKQMPILSYKYSTLRLYFAIALLKGYLKEIAEDEEDDGGYEVEIQELITLKNTIAIELLDRVLTTEEDLVLFEASCLI